MKVEILFGTLATLGLKTRIKRKLIQQSCSIFLLTITCKEYLNLKEYFDTYLQYLRHYLSYSASIMHRLNFKHEPLWEGDIRILSVCLPGIDLAAYLKHR